MSFRSKLRDQNTVVLRESLTYDEKVASQISKCLDALNENNVDYMEATCRALLVMVPTALCDEQFVRELKVLDEEWEEKKAQMLWEHEQKAKTALCPDVMKKPRTRPNREYWEHLLQLCIDLFQRKGVGFKIQNEEPI